MLQINKLAIDFGMIIVAQIFDFAQMLIEVLNLHEVEHLSLFIEQINLLQNQLLSSRLTAKLFLQLTFAEWEA